MKRRCRLPMSDPVAFGVSKARSARGRVGHGPRRNLALNPSGRRVDMGGVMHPASHPQPEPPLTDTEARSWASIEQQLRRGMPMRRLEWERRAHQLAGRAGLGLVALGCTLGVAVMLPAGGVASVGMIVFGCGVGLLVVRQALQSLRWWRLRSVHRRSAQDRRAAQRQAAARLATAGRARRLRMRVGAVVRSVGSALRPRR